MPFCRTTYTLSAEYSPSLETTMANLPDLFRHSDEVLYRGAHNRNVLKIIPCQLIDNEQPCKAVVKGFHRPNLMQRYNYSIHNRTKAHRSYNNAMRLRTLGFDSPEPLGYTEVWKGLLVQHSYYLSRFDPSPTLRKVMPNHPEVVKAFASHLATLHNAGILHHDNNPSNFLCRQDSAGNWHFSMVDVNRMQFLPYGKQPTANQRIGELLQFPEHDMALFQHFVRSYLEAAQCPAMPSEWEIVRQKLQRSHRRTHSLKHHLKHFDKLYYAILSR